MTRKILIVVSAALLLVYLLCSRSLWLSGLEKQVAVSRDRLSTPVDIGKAGKVVWRIPMKDWQYKGEVRVGLEVEKDSTLPRTAFNKDSMALRVVMDAKAVSYTPLNQGMKEVLQANRLIRNWYYTTDQPISPEARIWESSGYRTIEYGLGGVMRYPWEDTIIEMNIIEPDTVLASTNPRLVAYGEYDYAVNEHIGKLRALRDFVLCLLTLCVAYLAYAGIAMKVKR